MSVKDILKPKTRAEIWAITVQRHFVLMIGIPTMLVGLTMAITLLSCIPGSSYVEHREIRKVEWLEATGDSTYVNYVPTPPLVLDESLKKSVRDSITEVHAAEVTNDWVSLETKKFKKEPIKLPLVFKKNISFFKRFINITCVALLILISGLLIILPIVVMSKRYGDQDTHHYGY